MAMNYSLCLGTAGWGVSHSPDAGQSWTRHRTPFPLNSRIQTSVAHPTQALVADEHFARGTGIEVLGLRRRDRHGVNVWIDVRGIAVRADDPRVLSAGCGEATTGETGHVLRTTDSGESWEILPLPGKANATVW